ncbi:MAG: AMP-binding protein [Bryobacteraceae bacterium]|nr:AMP-binding protein [Bryobacteraceae bacterium]
MSESRWIWEPDAEWVARTNVHRFLTRLGFRCAEEFLRYSREKPEEFWGELEREIGIEWFAPYERVLDASGGAPWSRWFVNGKLNVAWNCVDRHARGPRRDNLALLAETEDGATRSLTYAELYEQVNRLANGLRAIGLKKGDRVALCMPMVPEVAVILYACLKLGLIAVPIFSGFGVGAIRTRLEDSGARVVFTAEESVRRGKRLPLREKVEQAAAQLGALERVVVWPPADLLSDATEVASLPLDSEDYALILYTSGTTGKPKGAVHTHAGCLAQTAKEIYLGFDHRDGDRFFWLSDIGWMMGPWELIGNHHFGGTVFLYDGGPDYPGPDRLWRMIESHRIDTFGISPTAVRVLMKHGGDLPGKYDLRSLRLLGSTGEPWDETSYLWYFEKAGGRRLPIINISGGTELIGSLVLPLPIQRLKPCTVGGPAPGMATEVVDEHGKPVRGRTGYLVCTKPAPSMTRGIWGDPQRYLDAYWSRWDGYWNHGDWASVDEDGYWFVHGRADESMNVAGRKVGPAEVEEALIEHPAVSEAAVIGVPDEIKGEAIVAFVVPKPGTDVTEQVAANIAAHVVETLGPTFRPREVRPAPELPKTQSGKVVRRLIRQRYLREPLGDLSTVANPEALEAFGGG